jgi:hypothetical protein
MVTPAHEVPPVCSCGMSPAEHRERNTIDAEGRRVWREWLRAGPEMPWHPEERRYALSELALMRCPARPGTTRPAPNRREEWYGSFGRRCALRDRWPGHNVRGDSHMSHEQASVVESNYLYKNQQVIGRTGRIEPDGIPRPLPGPDVPGWTL